MWLIVFAFVRGDDATKKVFALATSKGQRIKAI